MVVWVYAGGGESEVAGLIPFLEQHLPLCTFERKLPVRRRPGPKPDAHIPAYGMTGKSLIAQVEQIIDEYWGDGPDLVVIMDDSDKDDPKKCVEALRLAVVNALNQKQIDLSFGKPIITVALAVPELESWLLADWENTFKSEFGNCEAAAKHELSKRGVSFENPESFVVIDQGGTYHKLSEVLQDVIAEKCGVRYSKATDTPHLLGFLNPTTVSRKCPYFKKFWTELSKLCAPSKGARA